MKKIKGILILITLLVLIMGVASATEVSTDTLSTNTPTTSADNSDTIEVGEQTSIETSVTGSTDSLNTKNVGKNSTNTKENTHEDDKIVKNDKTSVKTSSHTYTVDTYEKLEEAIYTMDYDDITINIESDIVLTGSKGKYEDWSIKS